MYIALKCLVGMALAMWVTLCAIDFYSKNHTNKELADYTQNNKNVLPILDTSSIIIQQNALERTENNNYPDEYNDNNILQYVMFAAGACLVLIYNRKSDLVSYTKTKIKTIKIYAVIKLLCKITSLKRTAKIISVVTLKSITCMYKYINLFLLSIQKSKRKSQNINLVLLNKLKEYGQERRSLGHLLIAVIQENKNIRMQYQLETMAKKRLVRNIENTQKQMKENRSRYVSFQQLYIVTHQENIFLKSRIKKLTQDKEDAERNLVKLINHVWQSKNKELQAYCSRFIVQTRNNLLNSDVRAEIEQFLMRSSTAKQEFSDKPHNLTYSTYTNTLANEAISDEEGIVALVKDAPKLRGLPGEYVWTVKDKDGIIEKLYEYETDFDNGDTIRRIREYSVYYDKDCLLDFTSSTTLIHNTMSNLCDQDWNTRRITGSRAFQKFLHHNRNIVRLRKSLSPSTLTY